MERISFCVISVLKKLSQHRHTRRIIVQNVVYSCGQSLGLLKCTPCYIAGDSMLFQEPNRGSLGAQGGLYRASCAKSPNPCVRVFSPSSSCLLYYYLLLLHLLLLLFCCSNWNYLFFSYKFTIIYCRNINDDRDRLATY